MAQADRPPIKRRPARNLAVMGWPGMEKKEVRITNYEVKKEGGGRRH
jgi:hypothetical protein